jgi:hypothetical protein
MCKDFMITFRFILFLSKLTYMLVNLFELSIDTMNPTFKGFFNSLDV